MHRVHSFLDVYPVHALEPNSATALPIRLLFDEGWISCFVLYLKEDEMKRRYGIAAAIALFATVFCGALLLSGCSQVEKKKMSLIMPTTAQWP